MTPEELTAFGIKRHGRYWIARLARELKMDRSNLWKIAKGRVKISGRTALSVEYLQAQEAMKKSAEALKRKIDRLVK